MIDDFDYYHYLDAHPFTGIRDTNFKAKLTEKERYDSCFDPDGDDPILHVTRGKIYTIIQVEGFGDVADYKFINDAGDPVWVGQFLFEKPKDSENLFSEEKLKEIEQAFKQLDEKYPGWRKLIQKH